MTYTLQEILWLQYCEKTASHQVPMNQASAAFKVVELLKKKIILYVCIFYKQYLFF